MKQNLKLNEAKLEIKLNHTLKVNQTKPEIELNQA